MKDIIISGASPVLMPREDPAGKIVFVVLAVIVIVITATALVTLLAAVLRGQTQRARQVLEDSPVSTIFAGLAGWTVFGALAAWLYSHAFIERLLETVVVPAYFIAAGLAIVVPLLICLIGAPGVYTHIGDRIDAMRNRDSSDLQRVVFGSLVAFTAAAMPFIGWFLVSPLLLAAEFGAGIRSLIR